MSTTLTTIIAFVIVLSVLVFVHELGHFSLAKLFRVRVFEFAIGFPPRLVSWTRGETTYAVNSLPLGGYVRMMGENGTDAENPESFGYKPWWQWGLILLGGPIMNIALALVLFFVTAAWLGVPLLTNGVQAISKNSPAQKAGLRPGDRIASVDGTATPNGDRLHIVLDKHAGQVVALGIVRAGRSFTVHVLARKNPPVNQGAVGIVIAETTKTYSPLAAVGQSFGNVGQTFMAIPNLIHSLSQGRNPGVSGPIGIAHATGQVAMNARSIGIGDLFAFVALISASLGVFNLLPIPALDGGRILFVLLAGIRRRNVDPQLEGAFHLAGMAVLLILVALVSYQDIANWASGQ